MPDWQDTTGQKSKPPIRRIQCPQCRQMNMPDVKLCTNCSFVLRSS